MKKTRTGLTKKEFEEKNIRELEEHWEPMISTLGVGLMEKAVKYCKEERKKVGHFNYGEVAHKLAVEHNAKCSHDPYYIFEEEQ